jgi:hypothetical protein
MLFVGGGELLCLLTLTAVPLERHLKESLMILVVIAGSVAMAVVVLRHRSR